MDDVPHLTLPLRIAGERFVSVQQDTLDEVTACVTAIVAFPLGSRDDRPDYGVRQLELSDRPLDVLDIEQAVEAYEPRATVRAIEQPYDPADPLAARVRIEVSLMGEQEGIH